MSFYFFSWTLSRWGRRIFALHSWSLSPVMRLAVNIHALNASSRHFDRYQHIIFFSGQTEHETFVNTFQTSQRMINANFPQSSLHASKQFFRRSCVVVTSSDIISVLITAEPKNILNPYFPWSVWKTFSSNWHGNDNDSSNVGGGQGGAVSSVACHVSLGSAGALPSDPWPRRATRGPARVLLVR